jgi:hypothetical protein
VLDSLQKMLPLQAGPVNFLVVFALTTLISFSLALIIHMLIERKVQRLVTFITKPKLIQPPD